MPLSKGTLDGHTLARHCWYCRSQMTLSGSIERPRIIFAPWGWLETVAVVVVTRLDDAFAPDEVITWTTALWAANMIRQHRIMNPDMPSRPRAGGIADGRFDEDLDVLLIGKKC